MDGRLVGVRREGGGRRVLPVGLVGLVGRAGWGVACCVRFRWLGAVVRRSVVWLLMGAHRPQCQPSAVGVEKCGMPLSVSALRVRQRSAVSVGVWRALSVLVSRVLRQQGSPSAGFSVSLHRSVGRSVSPCPKPSTSSTVHLVHRPPRPPSTSSTVPEAVRQPSPSAHAGMGGNTLGGLSSATAGMKGRRLADFYCGWTALAPRHAGSVKLGDNLVVCRCPV